MNSITRLEDYRNMKNIGKNEILLIRTPRLIYETFYKIILRQLGRKEYEGRPIRNKLGDKELFELLTFEQQNHLEEIAQKLEPIIKSIRRIK